MTDQVSEQDLHAFVDGQLTIERQAEIERWLEQNPQAYERVREYQAINLELNESFDSVLQEQLPPHLLASIRTPKQAARPSLWLQAVAVLAFTLLGGAGGWWLNDSTRPAPSVITLQQHLVRPARVSHRVYTPEVVHPVEVRRDQEQHLVKWLSKRLSAKVNAPALDTLGFALIGGRLLPGDDSPAAQFMYENQSGQRITLYIKRQQNDASEDGFRYTENQGLASFYWIEGDLGYALTAPIQKAQLLGIAESVYRQLSFDRL